MNVVETVKFIVQGGELYSKTNASVLVLRTSSFSKSEV